MPGVLLAVRRVGSLTESPVIRMPGDGGTDRRGRC